jgi:hypothetical protein
MRTTPALRPVGVPKTFQIVPGANSRFSGICAIPNLCSLIDCWQEQGQEHGRIIPLVEVGSAGGRQTPMKGPEN